MRAKTIYEVKLAEIIKNTPNDADLGTIVRSFHNNYDFENEDAEKLKMLLEVKDIIESGYAGVDQKGTIVDRRKVKNAVPIQKNPLFNTPKPKKIND